MRGPALVFVLPVAVADLVPARDVAVAALRREPVAVFVAGRVPGRAGDAIAPVMPRCTWFFFAPALASGSGLPADRAA